MKIGFIGLEKWLFDVVYKIEMLRRNREKKSINENILPNYILNRRIKIITNGEVIFDSKDFKDEKIPLSIQYSIQQYGYPDTIKCNNKTPLIYNITSKAESLFPTVEEQNLCIETLK